MQQRFSAIKPEECAPHWLSLGTQSCYLIGRCNCQQVMEIGGKKISKKNSPEKPQAACYGGVKTGQNNCGGEIIGQYSDILIKIHANKGTLTGLEMIRANKGYTNHHPL